MMLAVCQNTCKHFSNIQERPDLEAMVSSSVFEECVSAVALNAAGGVEALHEISPAVLIGALKLLKMPTTAGASLTLKMIREAYKQQALETHPDAGGSTEEMRQLNEAYQMLRELYRQKA